MWCEYIRGAVTVELSSRLPLVLRRFGWISQLIDVLTDECTQVGPLCGPQTATHMRADWEPTHRDSFHKRLSDNGDEYMLLILYCRFQNKSDRTVSLPSARVNISIIHLGDSKCADPPASITPGSGNRTLSLLLREERFILLTRLSAIGFNLAVPTLSDARMPPSDVSIDWL